MSTHPAVQVLVRTYGDRVSPDPREKVPGDAAALVEFAHVFDELVTTADAGITISADAA